MSILTRAQEALLSFAGPWLFMWASATYFPSTVITLVRERKFGVLLSPSKFQEAWFGNFWGFAGPNTKLNCEARVIPLLDGRTKGGRVTEKPTGPGIGGTVIEIGAGSGFWVDIFSDKHLSEGSDGDAKASGVDDEVNAESVARRKGRSTRMPVTRVHGVEPNRDQHASLRQKVKDAGLEDVYQIVPVGIEHLSDASKWDGKVERGSVDCIVSILCLCSIPEPQKNFKELYGYLKKGGRWYVYEHVRTEANWGMRLYQSLSMYTILSNAIIDSRLMEPRIAFVNLFWPHFLGGCQLCRPTEKWLREAGPWEKVDVGLPPDTEWFHSLPHILGVFTK